MMVKYYKFVSPETLEEVLNTSEGRRCLKSLGLHEADIKFNLEEYKKHLIIAKQIDLEISAIIERSEHVG